MRRRCASSSCRPTASSTCAASGKRAQLADRALAERTTGYVVGGISPLGQRKRLPTTVDESALEWETILVSAGRRGLQIELRPQDLVELTGAAWPRSRRVEQSQGQSRDMAVSGGYVPHQKLAAITT